MGGVLSAKKGEESVPSGKMNHNNVAKQPKPEKLFFLAGNHSRNSSTSSSLSSETEREVKEEKEGDKEKGCRITGGCLCKISLLVYLLVCILVSALYVAIYGQNQQLFGEVWIPGKPTTTAHEHPKPNDSSYDLPYTEWLSQRWTYHDQPFSNWPTLPSYIDSLHQIAHGSVNGEEGVWLLSEDALYFALYLDGRDPGEVKFLNISNSTGIEVEEGSQIAVASADGGVYVITPTNISLLDCSTGASDDCDVAATNADPLALGTVNAAVVSLSTAGLWIGTEDGLYAATLQQGNISVLNASEEVVGPVLTLAWRSCISGSSSKQQPKEPFFFDPHVSNHPQDYLASSASHGVRVFERYPARTKKPKQPLDYSCGLLVVGTTYRLYFYDGTSWWFEWVSVWQYGLGGVVDGVPTGLTFGSTGELFVSNNVSISRLNENYTFDRIGPLQGLPYNQASAVYYSDYTTLYPPPTKRRGAARQVKEQSNPAGTLWIGTAKGYALFDIASSKFVGYFYGPRWHSGEAVLGFAAGGGNATVVLTDRGIAVVHPEVWTLERKAKHYQSMLERHTRPPGLVSDCPLTEYVPETCVPYTTDNDGLWTSWLVAAEAFRYQVTMDPAAQTNAWALFQGMQFLVNVTGVRGLMARSVVEENVSVDGDWYNSSSEPGWKWKGDTSSDEVVGHMFAYPVVFDLVADDAGEKEEVSSLVDDVVGYIKDNGYYLIDVTNHSTQWGVWAPEQLNLNQSWSDERGLNSLQILSYLLSAYRITGKADYLTAWKELFGGSYEGLSPHYALNIINQKITFPRDDNFSDDELAFLPYFVYFHTLKHLAKQHKLNQHASQLVSDMDRYASLSLQHTWKTVGMERSSAWSAIYAYATDQSSAAELREDLMWTLRTWPLELVRWRTLNSHRLDIRSNPEEDRDFHSHSQSVRVLPVNERGQLRWNENPYQLDWDGSSSEMDPGAWLMPYWFARWIKML